MRPNLLALPFLLLAACSSDGSKSAEMDGPDSGSTTAVADASAVNSEPCSDDGSAERAVLGAINDFENSTAGYIQLFALNQTGRLRDTGVKLGELPLPRAIDMRSDGLEAIVTWGASQPGSIHGFSIVQIEADASTASISQTTTLTGLFTPLRASYLDDDTIVLGRIGPGDDDLLPLSRQGDGSFAAGTPLLVPGEWPQGIQSIAGSPGSAFLLQSNLGIDSNLYVLSHDAGELSLAPNPIAFPDGPLFMYSNPTSPRAYFPEFHPDEPSCETCNPKGVVHHVSHSAGALAASQTYTVPNQASVLGLSPQGDAMYLADLVQGESPEDPEHSEVYRVNLDSTGAPQSDDAAVFSIPAEWIYQLLIGADGAVLAATDDGTHHLVVHTKASDGELVQCENDFVFPGRTSWALGQPQ